MSRHAGTHWGETFGIFFLPSTGDKSEYSSSSAQRPVVYRQLERCRGPGKIDLCCLRRQFNLKLGTNTALHRAFPAHVTMSCLVMLEHKSDSLMYYVPLVMDIQPAVEHCGINVASCTYGGHWPHHHPDFHCQWQGSSGRGSRALVFI